MLKLSALFAACVVASVFVGCGLGTAPGTSSDPKSSSAALSPAAFTSGDAFSLLPTGDLMLTVDAGTLINTTLPNMLKNSPKEKEEFDKEMAKMQEKSSIDPKQIKLVAISMMVPKGSEKPQFAGVMTGSWDAAKLTESLKTDEKTKAVRQTEQYEGQTIVLIKDGSEEVGVVVLDSTTLLVGSPVAMTKKAIDAKLGKGDSAAKDAELLAAFKSTKETGTLRFAMKFPKEQLAGQADETAKHLSATKILFGSVDASAGINLELVARTGSEAEAKPIHDDFMKLLEQGKAMMGGNEQMKSFESVLNSIVLSLNGPDVKLAMNVPSSTLEEVAKSFSNMGAMMGGGEPGSMPAGDGDLGGDSK
ncbi:MAG: hypothetical protein WBQ66_19350 [Blastocatellia bacterium]|jgi:hypothetical protein